MINIPEYEETPYGYKSLSTLIMLKTSYIGPTDDEGAEVRITDINQTRIREFAYDYKYGDAHSQAIAQIYKETKLFPQSKVHIEKDRVGLLYPFFTPEGIDVADKLVNFFKVSTTAGKIQQSYGEDK
jgi:hypothetical protein